MQPVRVRRRAFDVVNLPIPPKWGPLVINSFAFRPMLRPNAPFACSHKYTVLAFIKCTSNHGPSPDINFLTTAPPVAETPGN